MSYWTVILLGIIEGITEFLPISSTGHLLLAQSWMDLPTQPSELFNVVIQSGAVVAVLLAFADRTKQMVREWKTPAVRDYVLKLGVAFLVTASGVLVLKRQGLALPEHPAPVAWATLIGGVIILLIERFLRNKPRSDEITWTIAIVIGLAQLVAASFPGTSRSGACIMAALVFGLNRPAATEFSFLLGVPTLLAAGAYKIVEVLGTPAATHEPWLQLGLGTAVAAVTAFIAVRWLLRYVQSHTFILFGWYRVILGGLILVALVW